MCTNNNSIVVFDLETTGCNPQEDFIIEIGAIKVIDGEIVDRRSQLINPCIDIPEYITELTGINDLMIINKPTIDIVIPKFVEFCDGSDIMGHNILFDYGFIKANCLKYGYTFEKCAIDTLRLSRKLLPDIPSRKLGELCKYYNIDLTKAHRAMHDAQATYEVFKHLEAEFYNQNKELFIPQQLCWEPTALKMITDKQKSYLLGLKNKYNIKLEKPIEELTKSEASTTIDKILKLIRKSS